MAVHEEFDNQGNHHEGILDPESREFYVETLTLLSDAQIPFLLGGAYAFAQYTGIERHTKDLDVFVTAADAQRVLQVLGEANYATTLDFPHWLGKACRNGDQIDVIYSSGNGVCPVDDEWFEHARRSDLFGVPVLLMPPEEMIWQKALIQERERFDGADVAHVIHCQGEHLEWDRLLARFGPHWRVLLSHLVLFGYVYPSERGRIPKAVMNELMGRLAAENGSSASDRICQGTILSRAQYLTDIEEWGYADGRIAHGHMTPDQVHQWTAAIQTQE